MARKPTSKTKKTSYVKFGSTTFNIPAKMIGYDKKGHEHIYNTTTKRHNLAIHNGVPAIVIKENPNKSNIRITRVPRTTVVVKKVVRSDTGAHTSNNPAPHAPPQSANMPNPGLIPARPAPAPAPAPAPVPDVGNASVINQRIREAAIKDIQARIKMKIQGDIYKEDLRSFKIANLFKQIKEKYSAIDLQANVRRQLAQNQYKKNAAATKIQTAFRIAKARKIATDTFIENLDTNTSILQGAVRRQLGQSKYIQGQQRQAKVANLFGKIATDFMEADRQNIKSGIARGKAQELLNRIEAQQQISSVSRIQQAIRNRQARQAFKQVETEIQNSLKTGVKGRPKETPQRKAIYDRLALAQRVNKRIKIDTRNRNKGIIILATP